MSKYDDHYAIRELVERWSDGVNSREWAALEVLFTEEATWNVGEPLNFHAQGPSQIVALLREKLQQTRYMVQTPHAVIVDVQGDAATAKSTIHEACRFKDDSGIEVVGTYFDEFVRERVGWRFSRRTYRCTFTSPLTPGGQTFQHFDGGSPAQ
ncbi:MAG: hypothetical protein NAOJABEB_01730 [Steroidobacteraceae bacterium]|nr:hypothetical protein [Steroidobacteraceae bacterium]